MILHVTAMREITVNPHLRLMQGNIIKTSSFFLWIDDRGTTAPWKVDSMCVQTIFKQAFLLKDSDSVIALEGRARSKSRGRSIKTACV